MAGSFISNLSKLGVPITPLASGAESPSKGQRDHSRIMKYIAKIHRHMLTLKSAIDRSLSITFFILFPCSECHAQPI
jgi:hypothetical protein